MVPAGAAPVRGGPEQEALGNAGWQQRLHDVEHLVWYPPLAAAVGSRGSEEHIRAALVPQLNLVPCKVRVLSGPAQVSQFRSVPCRRAERQAR